MKAEKTFEEKIKELETIVNELVTENGDLKDFEVE